MFDKELALSWIAALRSGTYSQVDGTLCDGSSYCCLGVLADVEPRLRFDEKDKTYNLYKADMNEVELTRYIYTMWDDDGEFQTFDNELDDNFMKKVGLDDYTASYLIRCNDDEAYTFDMIADRIEQMLEAQELI